MTDRDRNEDLYALLAVPADADTAELSRAYRRRLREVHPDTRDATSTGSRIGHGPVVSVSGDPGDGTAATLRALQEAYLTLRDPVRRSRYDAQRRRRVDVDSAPSRRDTEPGDGVDTARVAPSPSPSTTGGVSIPVRVHRRPPRQRPPWIRVGPVRVEPLPTDSAG